MLKNYLLTAWRSLRKNASSSFLNIFGLSAGMTAAVLIFIWVQNETSFDGYHPDAKNIYRLTAYWSSSKWTFETAPLALETPIKSGFPDVLTVTALKTYPASLTTHMNTELSLERHCAYVDSNWFSVFHYDFVRGDAASFFRNPFSLVLTESKARKYFGDRDPIGNTIRIDTADYLVAAVVKDNPANSSFQFDMLMPVSAWLANPRHHEDDFDAGNFNYLLFLKLRSDAHPDNVAAAITSLYQRMIKEKGDIMSLTPLKNIHFETDLTFSTDGIEHTNRKTVDIFTILGILILMIACINYINLTTASASTRAKEVGVRKIVGAGRRTLFLQFTVETLLVSCCSVLITIFLIWLLMPFLRELTGRDFISPLKSGATWSIIGLTLLTATLLNSVYPALLLSSFRPLNVLKGLTILNFKDAWLRRGLVILQFTFSIILIAGTIIIQRQLSYIQHLDAGYNRSQTFEFRLPWKHLDQAENIKHDLSFVSSIADLATANESIVDMQSSNSGSADWDGHDGSFKATLSKFSPDEDFARVMGIQLRQGRWFDRSRPEDAHNFILNETAISEFNIQKPALGQRFTFQGDTGKIIGVVKDFHFVSLHDKIRPFVFFHPTHDHPVIYVKTQPGQIPAALAAARSIWTRNIADAPFDFNFLDDEFNRLYQSDTKASALILLFSVIAILISCLGLVGLASFTARRRLKEIGIRKVLGATISDIITLLSWEFMRLVLLSALIATPIAWWAANLWLRDFAYHIPLGGWTFALAGAIAVGIALLTVSSQSFKAAASNPAKNLRTE